MCHITNHNTDVPHQQPQRWCATSTTTTLMCHITNHHADVSHHQPPCWCVTSPTTTLMCHITKHNNDVAHHYPLHCLAVVEHKYCGIQALVSDEPHHRWHCILNMRYDVPHQHRHWWCTFQSTSSNSYWLWTHQVPNICNYSTSDGSVPLSLHYNECASSLHITVDWSAPLPSVQILLLSSWHSLWGVALSITFMIHLWTVLWKAWHGHQRITPYCWPHSGDMLAYFEKCEEGGWFRCNKCIGTHGIGCSEWSGQCKHSIYI
jgi:hypothetical protein